jgi:V/A-type H+-transporting ATPase subunit I
MTKVRILGRRDDAEPVLRELYRLALVEIADARSGNSMDRLDGDQDRSIRKQKLDVALAQTDKLLANLHDLPIVDAAPHPGPPLHGEHLFAALHRHSSSIEEVDRRLEELRDEARNLSGHRRPLQQLLPLVPVLARLDAEKLGRLRLATVALVLNADSNHLVESLHLELVQELGTRFELASTPADEGSMGCLVVLPTDARDTVRAMLGRAAVRSVALPERFEGLSLHATVDAMQRRIEEIHQEIVTVDQERQALLTPHAGWLTAARSDLAAELELLTAAGSVGATRRAFLAECWVPRPHLEQLRRELASRLGPVVVIEDLQSSRYDPQAPVLLRNARLARPFESLVGFLELPRAGSVDPTLLMAIFLPLMFGAMVGDIGYGAALLMLAILARRELARRGSRMPELLSLSWVLLMGAIWSIVFGALYGELFGDLGWRAFGDFALWQYRPSAGALEPLLVFAVVVGAAHVALGLGLGAWQAVHFREHRVLLSKLGTLLALGGLFGLAGLAANQLPTGVRTPSVAGVVIGLVLVLSLDGALGIITGALDLLGNIGSMLSYLRLAAVGLASAHLAAVANELGSIGPIWMGVLVATFLHALNLALASFSPMIQSLRLNYVEFFGAFFIGGGRAFEPFGHEQRLDIPSTT